VKSYLAKGAFLFGRIPFPECSQKSILSIFAPELKDVNEILLIGEKLPSFKIVTLLFPLYVNRILKS